MVTGYASTIISLLSKSHKPVVHDSHVSPGSPIINSVLTLMPSLKAVSATLVIASSFRLTLLICFNTNGFVLCNAIVKRRIMSDSISLTAMSTSCTVAFLLQLVSNNTGKPYFFFVRINRSVISMSRSLKIPKLASVFVSISILFLPIHSSSSWIRSRLNFFTLENVVPPQSQKVHINGQPLLVSITAFHIFPGYISSK